MSDLMLNWLRRDPAVTTNALALGPSGQKLFLPDPARFAVFLPAFATFSVNIWFGETPTPPPAVITLSSGNSLIVTEDDIGGMITRLIWATANNAVPPFTFFALSYSAHSFEIYRRVVHEQLSKYATP